MELPVQLLLESGGPLTSLFAKFWLGLYGPYLDFIGIDKHMAILRKRSNIEKILDRIDTLQTKREVEEKKMSDGIPQDKTNYLVLSNILITGLVIIDLAHITGLVSLNPRLLMLANLPVLVVSYTAYKLKKRINKRKKVLKNRELDV